jgi:hypothetical protein
MCVREGSANAYGAIRCAYCALRGLHSGIDYHTPVEYERLYR